MMELTYDLIADEDVHPELRRFAAAVLKTVCDDLGLDERTASPHSRSTSTPTRASKR